jgi:hypothetical protein
VLGFLLCLFCKRGVTFLRKLNSLIESQQKPATHKNGKLDDDLYTPLRFFLVGSHKNTAPPGNVAKYSISAKATLIPPSRFPSSRLLVSLVITEQTNDKALDKDRQTDRFLFAVMTHIFSIGHGASSSVVG